MLALTAHVHSHAEMTGKSAAFGITTAGKRSLDFDTCRKTASGRCRGCDRDTHGMPAHLSLSKLTLRLRASAAGGATSKLTVRFRASGVAAGDSVGVEVVLAAWTCTLASFSAAESQIALRLMCWLCASGVAAGVVVSLSVFEARDAAAMEAASQSVLRLMCRLRESGVAAGVVVQLVAGVMSVLPRPPSSLRHLLKWVL